MAQYRILFCLSLCSLLRLCTFQPLMRTNPAQSQSIPAQLANKLTQLESALQLFVGTTRFKSLLTATWEIVNNVNLNEPLIMLQLKKI